MKNNIIKLLCLVMVFAMLIALVGCKNSEDTNNSSLPTSSVANTETNSKTDAQDEDEEDKYEDDDEDEEWDDEDEEWDDEDEYDMDYEEPEIELIKAGNYRTLTNDTVYDLVDDVLDMQESLEKNPERFLLELGMDDQIIFYDDAPAPQNEELFNTLISFEPYKNKLLTYMSESYFNSSIFNDTKYIAEFECELYTRPITEKSTYTYSRSVENVIFKEKADGKHKYIVWLTQYKNKGKYTIDETMQHFNVTIVKKNGVYVLDAMESIEIKDALFKGYDKLNDETADLIIENYVHLKTLMHADICMFIEDLVAQTLKLDSDKTIKTKAGTLCKSNIKYKDFENAALEYMSKKRFKSDIAESGLIAEKDGYLYTEAFGASGEGFEVVKVKLQNKKNGKYEYLANCKSYYYEDTEEEFKAKAIIIKQNGVYVLDSYKVVEK